MVLDLGVLAPLSLVLCQLNDNISFLSFVHASILDPMLSYVGHYCANEWDWSVVGHCNTFILYDFVAGGVHPLW